MAKDQRHYELEELRLRNQYRVLWGLLIFVMATVNFPVIAELQFNRKPSDSILNNQNQSSLLITGALCNALGMLFGYGHGRSEKTKEEERRRKYEDSIENLSSTNNVLATGSLRSDSPKPSTEYIPDNQER